MTDPQIRLSAIPIWQGDIAWSPLKGGLSNESYTVEDATGRYVVRFSRDFPFHHVFREREVIAARAAHAAGFAPEVVHAAPGVMVSRFLEARTYQTADMRADSGAIADFMRRFHTEMARHLTGPGYVFWVFHVIRDYAVTLRAEGSRVTDRLERYLAVADALEAVQPPLPLIIGHHDLLPANFLHDGQRLWLIDFEYCQFGTAMFDLANATSNSDFTAEEAEAFLAAYFGEMPSAELMRAHDAMACASLLREAMWSMVSEHFLDAPGVDYVAYSDEITEKFELALDRYQGSHGTIQA